MVQPEARLGHKIREALEERGAFVFKVHGSGMMMAGLPDLIVCYKGRFLGLEVKMPGNKASAVQEYVQGKIRRAGGAAFVVYSVEEALTLLWDVE
ncbi:MAG: VRR-NUC domain-containing protein [Actinobacteria bacterium]|nr:VRR-NUC domain-containing protein [Actinomycetota bacterium]